MKKILPVKPLSARVPWHDNKWSGTFCRNVLDNSFCRILPRIDSNKNPELEKDGEQFNENNTPIQGAGAFSVVARNIALLPCRLTSPRAAEPRSGRAPGG